MKIIRLLPALAVLVVALFPSCKKHKGPSVPVVANLSLADSGTFLPGGRATMTVNAAILADGTYTLYYYVFPIGYNQPYSMPVHSTIVISNHTGTFQTVPLDTPSFVELLPDSLVSAAGEIFYVPSSYITLTDSTGLMAVQMNGKDTFKTPSVVATYAGQYLQVVATSPVSGEIGLYRYVYLYLNDSLGVQNLANSAIHSFYSAFINNASVANYFVSGEVTVTALAPLVTGSFSVTCADSTTMSGTFSCPAP